MKEFILIQLNATPSESEDNNGFEASLKYVNQLQMEKFTDIIKRHVGTDNFDVKQVMLDEQTIDIWHDDYFNPQQLDRQIGVAFEYGKEEFMPIFGSVILAGCSEDGATTSCPLSLDDVKRLIHEGKIKFVTAKTIEPEMKVVQRQEVQSENIPAEKFFFAPQTNISTAIH